MADNSKEVKQEEQKGTKQEQQASKMSLNTDEKEGTMDASVATKNLQNMSAASKQLEENRKKRFDLIFCFIKNILQRSWNQRKMKTNQVDRLIDCSIIIYLININFKNSNFLFYFIYFVLFYFIIFFLFF